MNVMYATDDNYVEIMAVSIQSLFQHNDPKEICLYIVTDHIQEVNKERLVTMVQNQGAQITLIDKPDIRKLLGVELKTLRWSDSAYSRLFLKLLYSDYPEVKKLLYIDCDTLITDSLQDLWNTDIQDYLGAACLECMSRMHKKIIGALPKDNYVNTGMLLLNVTRWKQEDVDSQMMAFIQKYNGKTEYVDQGVINGTISNRFFLVSPRYNLTSLAYDFTYEEMLTYRKPDFGYSKEEWEKAIEKPAIVHFTTSFLSIRPWYEGSKHPYAKQWKETHDETEWKDEPYRELMGRKKRDKKEYYYRKLPRKIAIESAGILHAYVKPLLYYLK
ncbi:MAG: glycosyltransferase family 8 protein [Lachnospiraceae bacterium]|nr:glycosyltransferase family 8 protein [Lachnospiraceae bacterium]